MKSRTMIVTVALVAVACGDPATSDDRGYTKAPLENPGLLVGGEDISAMSGLGRPNLPRPDLPREEREAEGAAEGAEEQVVLAPGVTREEFDQGKELFAGVGGCHACHGSNGGGSQLGPDLTDDQWLHLSGPELDALADVIRTGVSEPVEHPAPMPPMGGATLTEEQLRAVVAYVASIGQG